MPKRKRTPVISDTLTLADGTVLPVDRDAAFDVIAFKQLGADRCPDAIFALMRFAHGHGAECVRQFEMPNRLASAREPLATAARRMLATWGSQDEDEIIAARDAVKAALDGVPVAPARGLKPVVWGEMYRCNGDRIDGRGGAFTFRVAWAPDRAPKGKPYFWAADYGDKIVLGWGHTQTLAAAQAACESWREAFVLGELE